MKIAILGLGVIGTTYAYAFQKAGHQVEHVLRDSKRNNVPKSLSVDLLDGRYHSKGENKHDTYEVRVAEADSEYDFIFLSVRHGFVKEAVETLRKNYIKERKHHSKQYFKPTRNRINKRDSKSYG